jgi:predicted nucleic acid-binding protein
VSHPDALVAVLDANVLYPQWLRDLVLTLAALGYYEPRWSDRIIEEMRRNVLADHPDIEPDRFDAVTIAALRRAFATAWVRVEDDLVERMDNAPEDRHVLAAAVTADAHVIVTSNVDDFTGSRHVTAGNLAIESPATFLTTVLDDHPDVMATALLHLATHRRGVTTVADVLDELMRNGTLVRFVKAARAGLL